MYQKENEYILEYFFKQSLQFIYNTSPAHFINVAGYSSLKKKIKEIMENHQR